MTSDKIGGSLSTDRGSTFYVEGFTQRWVPVWPVDLHGTSCLHLGSNALPQTGVALRHVAQPDTAHLLQHKFRLVKNDV